MGTLVTKERKETLASVKKIEARDQTIVLRVDAERLYAWVDKTEPHEMYEFCVLKDNEHSSGGWPLSHFTSEIFIDKDVSWYVETTDPEYSVAMKKIVHEPNEKPKNSLNFFNNKIIDSIGNPGSQFVRAKVLNELKFDNEIYVYSIYFTIHPLDGRVDKDFKIDPKLCGNT